MAKEVYIAAAGLTNLSQIRIKFQQYDNFAIATDGIGWDNINVGCAAFTATATPSFTSTHTPTASPTASSTATPSVTPTATRTFVPAGTGNGLCGVYYNVGLIAPKAFTRERARQAVELYLAALFPHHFQPPGG